jgi:hypothetical protein
MPAVTEARRRTPSRDVAARRTTTSPQLDALLATDTAVSGTRRDSFSSSDAREKGTTMDEDEFDESLDTASVGDINDEQRLEPVREDGSRPSALRRASSRDARMSVPTAEKRDSRPGIVWVRASDLLSTGTGRIVGRGIDLEADLSRGLRRSPAVARRAIRERAADRLPPLTEFGRSTGNPPLFWYRLLRH